jgi:hypothetical protein
VSDGHDHYFNEKLSEQDPSFLLTRAFAAKKYRMLLTVLHTLRTELRTIVGSVRDPGVALNKIHWWQAEWQRLTEKRARHPVTKALQQLLSEKPPPLADATLALAQACSTDSPWENLQEITEYSSRLAEPFAALEADGTGDPVSNSELQRCWQDIELLATVSDLGRQSGFGGRSLPLDLLARHQHGPPGIALQDLIGQTLAQVNDGYKGCGFRHAHIYREVRLATMTWRYRKPGVTGELPAMRGLWAAWRGARFARSGQNP